MPVKTIFHSLEFVWECKWPRLNLHAMFWELKDAHSTEMDAETPDPVIDMMEEQKKINMKGGTMRLRCLSM